jgi:hypothetical protein
VPSEKCTLFTELLLNEIKISATFSLLDYRNNMYNSSSIDRIFDFYESFPNTESLIKWMRERPHGRTTIYECAGNRDIVVIIPTSNFDGDLAKTCRDSIFKGLQIIFVESGLPRDNYFNYAYSCNIGVSRALSFDPKWVVVSNDDMEKVDDVSKLIRELKNSNKDAMVIWTDENDILQHNFEILGSTILLKLLMRVSKTLKIFFRSLRVRNLYLFTKFNIYLKPRYAKSNYNFISKVLYKVIGNYKVPGHFSIYNPEFIKSMGEKLFDETFINGFEDSWLGINLVIKKTKCDIINYKIRPIEGASLGKGILRYLRNFNNLALYNYYVKENQPKTTKINPNK